MGNGKSRRTMNGKLIVRTGLITAAVIAALAYFCYNASYNPDFSAIDFITSASPKKKAKNRKDVQETVYSIQDFDLNEPLDGFDEIPVESGILLRRKTPLHTPMLFPVDADSPVYLKNAPDRRTLCGNRDMKSRCAHVVRSSSLRWSMRGNSIFCS